MAKNIDSLVEDIYSRLGSSSIEEILNERFHGISDIIRKRLRGERDRATLRMSNIGGPCDRKLWYSINEPERGEVLRGPEHIKFLYGDLLEELLFILIAEAGHKIQHRQAKVEINGIIGHIDGVIDGRLVDIKSASPRSFEKFRHHRLLSDDSFGYIGQLNCYLHAAIKQPEISRDLIDTDVFSFLAIDKVSGELTLDTYTKTEINLERFVEYKKAMVGFGTPPPRPFEAIPEGSSGNKKLGTVCSYCPFKKPCWPGLRTFSYSSGPVFLTKVVREPKVPEIA